VTRSPEGRQRRRLTATETDLGVLRQRAVLVGVTVSDHAIDVEEADRSLDELALLTDTAGAEPLERVVQRRDRPDPATYLGSGKLAEVGELVTALDADVVVFDDELTPAQQRNLERELKVDVVDRVALILDIFAQHATSREGMVQVELAQLRYLSPRLRGKGAQMSRQAGGIGARRGPGETQLETDRRRIARRITKLEGDLRDLGRTRETQRKGRRRSAFDAVALVGYTNAGKSTLLNQLTGAGVLVEDRLFSTLDPATRRLRLPGGETVLMSDTVGFVRKLPHQLVEAFRSTLEEVTGADLALHVVDAAAPDAEEQVEAVREVLRELGADELPELIVLNKLDVADASAVAALRRRYPDAVAVSARTGEGVEELLAVLGARLRARTRLVELVIPFERGDALAALHREGEVVVEVHGESATRVRARVPARALAQFEPFVATAAGASSMEGEDR
jgi:GTPase